MIFQKLLSSLLNKKIYIILAFLLTTGTIVLVQENLEPKDKQNALNEYCSISDLNVADDVAVYGINTKGHSWTLPYPIDDSNEAAVPFDVVINSPSQPAFLILGSYNPTVWKIKKTKDTKIAGVLAYGYHHQAVAGLDQGTPIFINTYDKCGEDFFGGMTNDENSLPEQLSNTLFGKSLAGTPEMKSDNSVTYIFGEPILEGTSLISSDDTPVNSFFVPNVSRVGNLGIEDALQAGKLRKTTKKDIEILAETYLQNRESAAKKALFETPQARANYKKEFIEWFIRDYLTLDSSFTILKDFTYPAGLSNRLAFVVDKNAPQPQGNNMQITVFDSQGNCQTVLCVTFARRVDQTVNVTTAPEYDTVLDSWSVNQGI